MKGTTMRTYILAILTAALFVLPTSAFSQVDLEVGPGGVYVGPRYHQRHYDDYDGGGQYGYRHGNRYGGGQCRELRQACLHKEELGEQGMGNCRRYRELCR
jgi:hypothetical protein